jgi:hypothetical protein
MGMCRTLGASALAGCCCCDVSSRSSLLRRGGGTGDGRPGFEAGTLGAEAEDDSLWFGADVSSSVCAVGLGERVPVGAADSAFSGMVEYVCCDAGLAAPPPGLKRWLNSFGGSEWARSSLGDFSVWMLLEASGLEMMLRLLIFLLKNVQVIAVFVRNTANFVKIGSYIIAFLEKRQFASQKVDVVNQLWPKITNKT